MTHNIYKTDLEVNGLPAWRVDTSDPSYKAIVTAEFSGEEAQARAERYAALLLTNAGKIDIIANYLHDVPASVKWTIIEAMMVMATEQLNASSQYMLGEREGKPVWAFLFTRDLDTIEKLKAIGAP